MLEPATVGDETCFNLALLLSCDVVIPEAIIVVVIVDGHLVFIGDFSCSLHVIDLGIGLRREINHAFLDLGIELVLSDCLLFIINLASLLLQVCLSNCFHYAFKHVASFESFFLVKTS